MTDVAAVTGSPEMLDGRVKTLHPRDPRRRARRSAADDHRRQLLAAAIAPFEVVVVNLYPFARRARAAGHHDRRAHRGDRHRRSVDGPGGRQEPRQRGDRDLAGALPRRPGGARQPRPGSTTAPRASWRSRRSRTRPPTTRGSRRSCRAAWSAAGLLEPAPRRSVPGDAHGRPREGRDAALRREPAPAGRAVPSAGHEPAPTGPFGVGAGAAPGQGAVLQQRPRRRRGRGARHGRLRGPAVVIVKHTNPCGAAERPTLLDAWEAALEADPVSAFGGVVALTREVDGAVAEALTSIFLEIVVAPAFTTEALAVLADEAEPAGARRRGVGLRRADPGRMPPRRVGSLRTAGGAVLVTAPDVATDAPDHVDLRHAARPDRRGAAGPRPRLATRAGRDLERDRARSRAPPGRDGQRPDLAGRRGATGRRQGARACSVPTSTVGAACASDAFFPFPDAVEVVPRGRGQCLRPARRLRARRRGRGGGRRGRRHDVDDRHAPLPPLTAGAVGIIGSWGTEGSWEPGGRDRDDPVAHPDGVPRPRRGHRAATPLELFFDLCFVVAVARPPPSCTTTSPRTTVDGVRLLRGVLRDLVGVDELHLVRVGLRHRRRALPAAHARADRRRARPGRRASRRVFRRLRHHRSSSSAT